MLYPSRSAGSAWLAVAAAVAYGFIEWLALWRSRAIDRLGARRSTRQG
jgi:hypothetical protein